MLSLLSLPFAAWLTFFPSLSLFLFLSLSFSMAVSDDLRLSLSLSQSACKSVDWASSSPVHSGRQLLLYFNWFDYLAHPPRSFSMSLFLLLSLYICINLKLHCSLSIKSVSAAPMSLNNFKLNISAAKYAMIAAAPHSLRVAALCVNAINIGKATGDHSPHSPSRCNKPCWRQWPGNRSYARWGQTHIATQRTMRETKATMPLPPPSAHAATWSIHWMHYRSLRCGRFCGTV